MVTQRSCLVLGVLLAGLVALGCPQKPDQAPAADKGDDISGTYSCEGTVPGGKTYKGTTTVAKKGDTYVLKWTIGGQTHEGTGLRNGDLLSVCWQSPQEVGIVVYKIEKA